MSPTASEARTMSSGAAAKATRPSSTPTCRRARPARPVPEPGRRVQAPHRLPRHDPARAQAARAHKHQYDYDSQSCFAFLQRYGLEDEVKVNIEVNHATLSGHDFQHELAMAAACGILGSVDANRGDDRLGWDTDHSRTRWRRCRSGL